MTRDNISKLVFNGYPQASLRGVLWEPQGNPMSPIDLERVLSIESRESPQCSTNVIGAFQGYTL